MKTLGLFVVALNMTSGVMMLLAFFGSWNPVYLGISFVNAWAVVTTLSDL